MHFEGAPQSKIVDVTVSREPSPFHITGGALLEKRGLLSVENADAGRKRTGPIKSGESEMDSPVPAAGSRSARSVTSGRKNPRQDL
jgi:hypothetical protein